MADRAGKTGPTADGVDAQGERERRQEADFSRTLGDRIREFRVVEGWTQLEMARRLGMTQQELSQLEVKGNPSAAHLYRLRSLGLDVERLFDAEGEGVDPVMSAYEIAQNLYGGGVVGVFSTRLAGLQSLMHHLERERRGIHIVGSSLKGLFMDRVFWDTLESRVRDGVELKILISHPAFAVLRAWVEGRESQGISQEIDEAKRYCGKLPDLAPDPTKVEIRVALHPPTIFSIFLLSQRRALINPYCLTIEAYSTPCILTANTGRKDCMFQQCHLYHFSRAWDSRALLGRDVSIALEDERMASQQVEEARKSFGEALRKVTEPLAGSAEGTGQDT